MYIGHLGIALGTKGLRRDAPLWLLIIATQACDWVDASTCAAGIEPTGMWSHSLLAVLSLAITLCLVSYAITRNGAVGGIIGAVVLSHVLVDYVTGTKPSWPGGPTIGFNLYAHPVWEFALEVTFIAAGWLLYRRSLPPMTRTSQPAKMLLVALLGVQLLGDVKVAVLPSPSKCQWSAARHRQVVTSTIAPQTARSPRPQR